MSGNRVYDLYDIIAALTDASDRRGKSPRSKAVKAGVKKLIYDFQFKLAVQTEKFRDDIVSLIHLHYLTKEAPDHRSEYVRKLINASDDIHKLLDSAYDLDAVYQDLYDVPAFGRSSRENSP